MAFEFDYEAIKQDKTNHAVVLAEKSRKSLLAEQYNPLDTLPADQLAIGLGYIANPASFPFEADYDVRLDAIQLVDACVSACDGLDGRPTADDAVAFYDYAADYNTADLVYTEALVTGAGEYCAGHWLKNHATNPFRDFMDRFFAVVRKGNAGIIAARSKRLMSNPGRFNRHDVLEVCSSSIKMSPSGATLPQYDWTGDEAIEVGCGIVDLLARDAACSKDERIYSDTEILSMLDVLLSVDGLVGHVVEAWENGLASSLDEENGWYGLVHEIVEKKTA